MDASPPSASTARDLVTVDLRGLKSALCEQARARGVSVSAVVREALTPVLVTNAAHPATRADRLSRDGLRARLSLRLHHAEAAELAGAARAAGLSLGAYILELMRRNCRPPPNDELRASRSVLSQSNAELATLSRNIARLTLLLRQGEVRQAQEYRHSLDALNGQVKTHLAQCAEVLRDVSAAHRSSRSSHV